MKSRYRTQDQSRLVWGICCFIGFVLCVPLANWFIENVGTYCVPDGPCLIPVFPGVSAPSGVLFVGLAFVLRDFVQRQLGLTWAIVAIVIGALLSGLVSSRDLVLASVLAFAISETLDLLVYTPLQKRNFLIAVLVSGIVGAAVDSVVFVWIAFGSLDYVWGQIIGKLWMTLGAVLIISVARK